MTVGGLKRIRCRYNDAAKVSKEHKEPPEKPKRVTELESLLAECGDHYEKLIKFQQHKINVIQNNISAAPFIKNSINPMMNELYEMENRLNNIKKLLGPATHYT